MSRRKKSDAATAQIRRPRPAPAPLIDARLLMVAGVIASPAIYRASQGLLSPSAAMDRFLVIAIGCLVLSGVVRTVWQIVQGETARPAERVGLPAGVPPTSVAMDPLTMDRYDDLDLGADAISGVALPPVGRGLDLLEDAADPLDLLRFGD